VSRQELFSGPVQPAQIEDARGGGFVHGDGGAWSCEPGLQRMRCYWRDVQSFSTLIVRELIRTQVVDGAAALAFWSMMSIVPLLITVAALLSILRLPGLLPQLLSVLAMLVPADGLATVERMIGGLLEPHRGMLSFGILSYIWSTTGGFTALISALNVAYDVTDARSWLHDRLRALLLAATSGGLLTVSLLGLLAGPHFGHFLGEIFPVPGPLQRMWPLIRLVTVFVTFVVGLELVYYLGPNRKQRFTATLPGAVVAIALWFAGSAGLAFYLKHLAHYSRLYGGMGALIGLMFWIYITALAVLVGAELNAELAKRRGHLHESLVADGLEGEPPVDAEPRRERPAA